MAKVSIIIPVYNQYKKLLACLDSIKKQSFTDYEVILVNDGSTDISEKEIKNSITHFSSSIFLSQDNRGAPTARNGGFTNSTGDYVIFCDADIIMRPAMLAKMVNVLDNNPDISYVYSSFKFGWKKFKLWEFDAEKLKKMPYIHTTSLIRREHFPDWDESIKRLQDWDLWLTMLEQGHTGKWISELLFIVKPGGTMSAWLPSFMTKLGVGKKAKEYKKAVEVIKQKHNLK